MRLFLINLARAMIVLALWICALFVVVKFAFGQDIPADHSTLTTIDEAIAILGREKTITAEDAQRVFGDEQHVYPRQLCDERCVPYNHATLLSCADENKYGQDWRLVCSIGLSLHDLMKIRGTDADNPPCFFIEKELNDWIMRQEEGCITRVALPKGWWLIDMKPRWSGLSWQKQEEQLQRLGERYSRAHQALVSETLMDFYVVQKERLLSHGARDAHWSAAKTSSGAYVRIWFFMDKAVSFWPFLPDSEAPEGPGVCVMLKY